MNYITTNRITPRGYLWRSFLTLLGLGIIATIAGVYRFISEKNITHVIESDEVKGGIKNIGSRLDAGENITLTSGSLTASPSQITIRSDDTNTIAIDTESSCNDFFNQGREGVLATQDALCIVDSRNRQQSVTRQQVHQARQDINLEGEERTDTYPTIASVLTSDPLVIDQATLQSISSEMQNIKNDPETMKEITQVAHMIRWPLIVGGIIIFGFMSILIALFGLLIPILILALISQIITKIAGIQTTLTQEFSKARLPGTIILILVGLISPLTGWMGIILGLIFPVIRIIQQKKESTH